MVRRPSALSLPDPEEEPGEDELVPTRIGPSNIRIDWTAHIFRGGRFDPNSAVVPVTSTNASTGTVSTVNVNVTLQTLPPVEELAKPTRNSRGKAPRAMFSKDRYGCTCRNLARLCVHIQAALLAGDDIGKHTVISKTTLGRQSRIYIPLTDEVLVPFDLTVRAHPSVKDEFLLEAADAEESSGVTALLTRHDGLLILVNKLRDWYRSTVIFEQVRDKILNKKRLPCTNSSHGHQNDVDLVKAIKSELASVPNIQLEIEFGSAGTLYTILEEVMLNNAYYLIRKGMCFSCHSYTVVSPDDVPDI